MKKKTIITISVIAVLVLTAGIGVRQFGSKTTPYYWRSVPLEKGDMTVLVTATGSMAADTSVDIGVQVSGTIARIKVDFNDVVKKGQVIAVLDTTLFYAAKLDATAALQGAQASYDEKEREFNREKILFNDKMSDQADYDLALTAYQTAKGNLTSAKADLYKAVINLKYCTITAPINGVIIARNVQVGNMVIASFNSPVLFTIANNLKRMQVQADVDEADIGQVKVGQQVKFTVGAYPNDVFTGQVTQVRRQPVMVQNVVNYVVIIEVPNPELKLMPGLTANSNILIQEHKNVLKVPANALTFAPPPEYIQGASVLPDSVKKSWLQKLRKNNELKKKQIADISPAESYLWIKNGQDIVPIRVSRGLNDGMFTEVSGELQEGNEVVTGINHSPPADKATQNPFMPKFPSKKKM